MLSKIQKFNKAKKVLKHMLFSFSVFENMEEKSLCIANSYVAVSQYYYILMEFDEVCYFLGSYNFFYSYKNYDYLGLVMGSKSY